jgi:valyl-tRNA synthetase
VHRASWPTPEELGDVSDDGSFAAAVSVVTQVRRAKSDAKVSLRYPVVALRVRAPHPTIDVLGTVIEDVMSTINGTQHELIGNEGMDELEAHVELADAPEPSGR